MRLYSKRKANGERVWWASYTDRGVTVRRSTRCSSKPAAELVVARWERERADPAYAAANSATLGGEAAEFLKDCRRAVKKREASEGKKVPGSMSPETLKMYEQKIGNLLSVLGVDASLGSIDATTVKAYVDQRLEEGAQESTVYKEWVALRGVLKNAKHFGRYHREIGSLKPPRFSGQSKPGRKFLTWDQARRVLRELESAAPGRLDTVRFVIATGARRGEWNRAQPGDVVSGFVLLRGTKTKKSWRTIPVPAVYASLLDGIKLPLPPWPNARRDIHSACLRASVCPAHRAEERHEFGKPGRHLRPVPRCADCTALLVPLVTWNDLRRTFNSLLSHEGVSAQVRAELMGHTSTAMVDETYTQIPATTLRAMLELQLPASSVAPIALLKPKPAELGAGGSRLVRQAKGRRK